MRGEGRREKESLLLTGNLHSQCRLCQKSWSAASGRLQRGSFPVCPPSLSQFFTAVSLAWIDPEHGTFTSLPHHVIQKLEKQKMGALAFTMMSWLVVWGTIQNAGLPTVCVNPTHRSVRMAGFYCYNLRCYRLHFPLLPIRVTIVFPSKELCGN